jgi:hypothetical protein
MKKTTALKILNPILAVLIAFQLVSALFPAQIPYDAHRYAGIAIFCGIGLHLFLNWNWIKANLLKR